MMWFLQMAQLSTTMSENIYWIRIIENEIETYPAWHQKSTYPMPTKQQHSTAMNEKEMISFNEKEKVPQGSGYEEND